jgi:poly(beta-D-mannuronate) lyase
LKGTNFRSALAVMNGIPKSPLNRYNQVTDVVVAYNTWVNCNSPLQFSVGTNVSQKDVLPLSEIRSARPTRTIVANNLIYNQEGDEMPIVAYEEIDGVAFESNIINNQNVAFRKYDGLNASSIQMTEIAENIFVPAAKIDVEVYDGFDFETITTDLFGNSRAVVNSIGASCKTPVEIPDILAENSYGASWFSSKKPKRDAEVFEVSPEKGDLATIVAKAQSGDVIEFSSGSYDLKNSLHINKRIVFQSKNKEDKAEIHYTGEKFTPAFEMYPEGDLSIKNVVLTGNSENYAFASLKDNMLSLYNIHVEGCEISMFDFILKAYKETFSDEIVFVNSVLKDCKNGIELSEETDDNGDYNVEFLTIDNCRFENIDNNVIDYYRGGYDESTIGGNLLLTNSTFTNCGRNEETKILLNTRGIVNVDISNNTFRNNPVKVLALLWGAKNNTHSNNTIINSGKIVVEENIKLKLMY